MSIVPPRVSGPVPSAATAPATPPATPPAATPPATPSSPGTAPTSPTRDIRRSELLPTLRERVRSVRADVVPRTTYQRWTYAVAAALLLSGLAHVGVWAVDGGSWEGAVSWRKPILFGVSFGLFGLSAGWVQGVLPRSAGWGWSTTALMSVGAVGEVALISAQRWRGTASHFNVADPVDATVFILMGVTIAVFSAGVVLLGLWAAIRLRRPAPTVIAVVVGIALVVVGSALGGDLMTRGMASVEATGTVPAAVVIGAAGSGKLAHAVALHGLQVLAVLAVLLGTSGLAPAVRSRAMAVAATGYLALTAVVAAQAYAGRSMLELTGPVAAGIGLAALAVLAPFGLVLRDAVRR